MNLSKERVMADGELTRKPDKTKDEFGLPMTLTERILKYVAKELEKEGIKDEGLDKDLYYNELITRTKKWWIKAQR